MDKLKINLIPPEIKALEKKQAKRSLITRISVGLLGLLILATAGLLAVIIFQNATVNALNGDLEQERTKLSALKDKEAVVFFLKNRIDTINQYAEGHYPQGATFELISGLIPPGISLTSLQIDKTDAVILQGNTTTISALNALFSNLLDPSQNEGKIKSVSVESLSRSQTGTIGFDLKITVTK